MGYEIRRLVRMEEFREHERLQRVIWGSDRIDVPANLLAAGARHGAVVLGAYAGGEMIGLLYGFPALTDGRPHHHSHMLGVLPSYRRHGVGRALKERQREEVRAQGLDAITWTVDPLEVGNNLFNFGTLGVTCRTYLVDAYGAMDDALNRGLPSDRLEVTWPVERRHALPTRPAVAGAIDAHDAAPVALAAVPDARGLPAPSPSRVPDATPVVVAEAPRDHRAVIAADPALALEWRLALRRAFRDAFDRSYVLVGCVEREGAARYVLMADPVEER